MKGIIYVRVSSEEQVKGTSLENQDELCRAYCKSKGIEVVGIYREEGALNWYSHSGHLEKSDIENKLIEVRDDNRKKELFKAI